MRTDDSYGVKIRLTLTNYRLIQAFTLLLLTNVTAWDAYAETTWESLITPGPLITDHEDLDGSCSACHSTFSKIQQAELCLDCHEDIRGDIDLEKGFHGNSKVGQSECKSCHAEHLGKDADIVGFIPETFEHDLTDFPLLGVHKNQVCGACHLTETKYREAGSACADCHKSDDIHRGGLGIMCGECHTSEDWIEVDFDHAATSDFVLAGAHAETKCNACHIDRRYEGTPAECVDCHKLDDVHSGRRGDECQSCHTSESWQESEFQHGIETGFELLGVHADLTCNACHLEIMALEKPPADCNGCHSSIDPHLGSRGPECADCHNSSDWKISFDHALETGFALVGQHLQLRCEQCHVNNLKDSLPTTCEQCHQETDPHGGTLGACESCHGAESWTRSLRFDHEFTNFPLFGLHRLATCDQCHVSKKFDDAELGCNSCHKQDEPHSGTFGSQCQDCHSPGGWELWQFDHDKQTAFMLSGSHADLICASCHSKDSGMADNLSQQCSSCHLADDVHGGQFGNQCSRCHTTESFDDNVRFR